MWVSGDLRPEFTHVRGDVLAEADVDEEVAEVVWRLEGGGRG